MTGKKSSRRLDLRVESLTDTTITKGRQDWALATRNSSPYRRIQAHHGLDQHLQYPLLDMSVETAAASAAGGAVPMATAKVGAAAATNGAALQGGVVRSCPSGDTLVVRPRGVATPGAERTIHIAGIAAPRMGSRERDDEPFAFPSREFSRKLLVGREVRFRIEYTVPIPGGGAREYVHVSLPPEQQGGPDTNVAHKILAAGWARVHDSMSRRNVSALPEEEEEGGWKAVQRSVQDEAQGAALGIWGPDDLLKVEHNMGDTAAFLAEWKGKEIDSIVEQVRDGTMLRVRLLLSPRHHQVANLSLAGIKAPRIAGAGGPNSQEPSEPYAEEARFFVESRLLQRNVRVKLLSMPQPVTGPTPLNTTASSTAAAPAPTYTSSVLIGQVIHPVGDIAQFLLASGLAKCVDWHAGMLAGAGGMETYRVAEKAAKDKRTGVWTGYQPPAKSVNALPASPEARTFEGLVVRVISGDTIHVRRADETNAPEKRVHLSSIRQPLVKDEKQAGYAQEARELLRKRLVGRAVSVQVDYVKKEPNSEERTFATVRALAGPKEIRGADIGDMLLQRGLATVTRHRAGDEDRSPQWDRLMALETEASAAGKGVHSGKESAGPKYVEASESAGKAHAYLTTIKRQGRTPAIVDFCASASRFKVIVPRENCRMTFVLAGIRAPKTARNASERDEPYAREGLDWTTNKALQRDVEIEVFSIDKAGGFIGAMYLNRTENLAVGLIEAGFVSVHRYSAESLSFGSQLLEAEARARKSKAGMWVDAEDETEDVGEGQMGMSDAVSNGAVPRAANGSLRQAGAWGSAASPSAAAAQQPRTEYVDLTVSDVRGDGGAVEAFGFSVQILNDRIQELEKLMQDLQVQTPAATSSQTTITPKVGDWVSAKFSGDGQWYRGQVVRNKAAQKAREVRFVDYGNFEDVPYADIRPLDDARFGKRRLPGQAIPARLSFVKLYEGKGVAAAPAGLDASQKHEADEYALDALYRFRDLVEGRKLIANIDFREPSGLLHLTLYDPTNAEAISLSRPEACLNADLCREGHATVDRRVPYLRSSNNMVQALSAASAEARRTHRGMFELGDPTGDD